MFFKFLLFILFVFQVKSEKNAEFIFPCYYYNEPHNLKPESIPASNLCTHILLAGCVNDNQTTSAAELSTSPFNCANVLRKLHELKKENAGLKLIITLATNADSMHVIVNSEETMLNYARSSIDLANEFDFDGIDFDWEYPCDEDKLKFTHLLSLFRAEIKERNLKLTLSAAIGAGLNTIKNCFDLNGLSEHLDFINVMCYDYNSIYNKKTAYSSPLFARPEETDYDATLNTNFTINYLIENNVPKSKIVVGLNSGGHTYQLADPVNQHDFHAPVLGVGYSAGWSVYPQLCEILKTKDGYGIYDDVAEVLYAYYDDQWANTGDVVSARAKARWAKKMGLAGVFTWCLNWDDIYDMCGHGVTFPIHRAIRDVLFNH